MKHATIAALLLSLCGCYTQPTKLATDDFWWTERTVAATPEQVYHRLQDGFRQCTHFAANCFLTEAHTGASCDVFKRDSLYGAIEPLGIVTVATAASGGSLVRVGAIKPPSVRSDGPIYQGRRTQWISLAEGATCR